MSQPEEFRDNVYVAEGFDAEHTHGDPIGHTEMPRYQPPRDVMGRDPLARDLHGTLTREAIREPIRESAGRETAGRAAGSPLPSGSPLPAGNPLPGAAAPGAPDAHASRSATPPGRALSVHQAGSDDAASARAMNILKQALPFVKGLLPLLDGTIGTALSNMITGRTHVSPPSPPVDLAPVMNQISELQLQQGELRTTVQEQTAGLKHVEDQLEMVREATDRNTLEQQELIEDLKMMGNKVNLFALLLSALLLASIVLNVMLYMHIKKVLQ